MSNQLDIWRGQFGAEYTDRNVVDWRSRVETWRRLVGGRGIESVLEVGCNRGHNLVALREVLGPEVRIVGIEPQPRAREIAKESLPEAEIMDGSVYAIPFPDASFDLVFTSGVLIHVPLEQLDNALEELHRVSRRYVLSIEYFAEEETTIDYRGYNDLLWKRDFGAHHGRVTPELELVSSGDLTSDEGFERARWWLFSH